MTDAERDLDMLKEACSKLGEHFDTVLILTTRHDPTVEGGTVSATWGTGNWFARYGQCREYLLKCEERTRCDVREDGT